MNKKILSLILLVLFVNLTCSVLAEDIAYVVRDTNNPEDNIITAIDDLGYSYELIDDSDILFIDFSEYEMILVWDELLNNYDKIPITEKKALVGNSYYLETWKIAQYAGSQISTGYMKSKVYEENRITEGISGIFDVYDEREVVLNYLSYKPKRAPGLQPVVVTDNYQEYPVIGIINPGGGLFGGGICEERTVFFGITGADYWTEESEELFKNSIEWTLYGDDSDEDGFYYDEDCDDKDPDINPDATEIAYNDIDEDCDGSDLRDVDEDGYDSWEVGGPDCDDFDLLFNPGSEDIYMNCENDAPIIEPIDKITESEGEEVLIEVYAEDPELDSLYYSINDSRFEQDENLFTWQTDFYDKGTYYFTITVSDGDLESEIIVEVEINDKNQKPICDPISPLEWDEDETYELKLGDYCYDLDADELSYDIHDTSTSDYISIDSFENDTIIFSSKKDWNGEDWIIFITYDGIDNEITNNVTLRVLEVNDAPIFYSEINNITWKEDINLTDYLTLGDYFIDIDSELEYDADGNNNTEIIINNGEVSFIPDRDWYGSEMVIFSAYDGEFLIYSNPVNLTVYDANEPPELVNFSCNDSLLEDVEETCSLEAEDFEGEDYWFSSSGENDLDCYFDDNILHYISYPDYNGEAGCKIRVNDEYGYSEYDFEVNIEGVNDAPRIEFTPNKDHMAILEGNTQLFEVEVTDVDGDIFSLLWKLNEEPVSSEEAYLFNKSIGTYTLNIIANDSELESNHIWTVRVGDISEFTCNEVGGDVCEENEMCYKDNILGVKDTDRCCNIPCMPKFEEIGRCENVHEGIEINIKDPNEGEKFSIGEIIVVVAKIKNNLGDSNIDVDAYFYDLTDDEIIDEDGDSLGLDNGESDEAEFEFKVDQDLDNKDYAIFVKAEDEYCNEQFVKVNIEREKDDVLIKDIDINGNLECGKDIEISVKAANLGSQDQDVMITLENSELNISEKSEGFELEKYGNKNDQSIKYFRIEIPESAKGNYKLLISAYSESKKRIREQEIFVECEEIEQSQEKIETISLGKKEGAIQEDKNNPAEDSRKGILLAITLVTTILVIAVIVYLVYFLIYNSKLN